MNEPGGGKMKMLHSFLLLSALFAAVPAAADSDEERVAAAKRYLEVAQMSKITDDTVNELAKGIPAEQRDKFLDFMHNAVRPEVLEQAAMASMVKVFTADELNALADFFGSSVGRSAMGKFGLYMADVMPVIQQEMFRALQALPRQ
jgi:hypothetical protein